MSDTWIGTTVLTGKDAVYDDDGEKVFDLLERNGQEVIGSNYPILFVSTSSAIKPLLSLDTFLGDAIATDELKTETNPTGFTVEEVVSGTGSVTFNGDFMETSGQWGSDVGYIRYSAGTSSIPDVTSDWCTKFTINGYCSMAMGSNSFTGNAASQRIALRGWTTTSVTRLLNLEFYISGHGFSALVTDLGNLSEVFTIILRHSQNNGLLYVDVFNSENTFVSSHTLVTTNLPTSIDNTVILGAVYSTTGGGYFNNFSMLDTFESLDNFFVEKDFVVLSKTSPDPTGRTKYKVIADKT